MTETPQQIADDLERTRKAIDALIGDIAQHGCDPNHVQMRLSDFSSVLSGLRQRVLSLPNQQSTTVADEPQEKQDGF